GDAAPAPRQQDCIATGDLGYLDGDGFLHLTGRKKSSFITSFGRNVAPEWVERELVAHGPIAQAAVFGEARPFNSAVLAVQRTATPQAVEEALAEVNRRLPDYARVRAWLPASEPFTPGNGMLTPNGRLRRASIFNTYAARIDALYQQLEHRTQ
ncbi:MAG: AMP-dependent synthetase and ligase, partial [Ramlibacter sp.]|nr:AMP-dependent synthetase and ligase [Ramlibacter sp.]